MQTGRRGFTCRGFTYLWLLFVVAISAAAMAALGQRWTTAAQREKELELIFRGRAIAQAIAAYRSAPGAQWPRRLEDLVEDLRGPKPRHHLRQLYADPFTGRPDWVLLTGADGSLRGVRSRSDAGAWMTDGIEAAPADRPLRVSDRRFMAPATPATNSPFGSQGRVRFNE